VLFGKKVSRGIKGIFTTLKSKTGMSNMDYGKFKIIDAPLYMWNNLNFPWRSHLFNTLEYLVQDQLEFKTDFDTPLDWLTDDGTGLQIKEIRYVYSQLSDAKIIALAGNFLNF
jgi:hypothetical protein